MKFDELARICIFWKVQRIKEVLIG